MFENGFAPAISLNPKPEGPWSSNSCFYGSFALLSDARQAREPEAGGSASVGVNVTSD